MRRYALIGLTIPFGFLAYYIIVIITEAHQQAAVAVVDSKSIALVVAFSLLSLQALVNLICSWSITVCFRTLYAYQQTINENYKRLDEMLENVLPKSIIARLRSGPNDMIMDEYENACVAFIGVCNVEDIYPGDVTQQVILQDEIWTLIDQIVSDNGVWKIEQVGSDYLLCAGAPVKHENPAALVCKTLCIIRLALTEMFSPAYFGGNKKLCFRMGVSTGAVVSGIIGYKRKKLCFVGDTLNVAARMKYYSEMYRIHADDATALQINTLRDSDVIATLRGEMYVKGKGQMLTYWIDLQHNKNDSNTTPESETTSDATRLSSLERYKRVMHPSAKVEVSEVSSIFRTMRRWRLDSLFHRHPHENASVHTMPTGPTSPLSVRSETSPLPPRRRSSLFQSHHVAAGTVNNNSIIDPETFFPSAAAINDDLVSNDSVASKMKNEEAMQAQAYFSLGICCRRRGIAVHADGPQFPRSAYTGQLNFMRRGYMRYTLICILAILCALPALIPIVSNLPSISVILAHVSNETTIINGTSTVSRGEQDGSEYQSLIEGFFLTVLLSNYSGSSKFVVISYMFISACVLVTTYLKRSVSYLHQISATYLFIKCSIWLVTTIYLTVSQDVNSSSQFLNIVFLTLLRVTVLLFPIGAKPTTIIVMSAYSLIALVTFIVHGAIALELLWYQFMQVSLICYFNSVEESTMAMFAKLQWKIEYQTVQATSLLGQLLPEGIVNRMTRTGSTMIETIDNVAVLQCDLIGSTTLAGGKNPAKVFEYLHALYTKFDEIGDKYDVHRITTMGDAYVAASGRSLESRFRHDSNEQSYNNPVSEDDDSDVVCWNVVQMGMEMCAAVSQIQQSTGVNINIRVGISFGKAVGGLIGTRQQQYLLWGDVLKSAGKMEAESKPNQVKICAVTKGKLGRFLNIVPADVEMEGGRDTIMTLGKKINSRAKFSMAKVFA